MELKFFQEKAIDKILKEIREILDENRTGTIVFQSPTGSGKTFTMSNVIQKLALDIDFSNDDFCFVWVSIGKGELHKQSYKSLLKYFDGAPSVYLLEQEFFGSRSCIGKNEVVVVNWDKINQKDSSNGEWKNILMKDKEAYNFSEILENTREKGRKIVLIIDESHQSTTTARAIELRDEIIKPVITLEMSATPALNRYDKLVPVNPNDPIYEGLIKKEIVINQDIDDISTNEIDSQELIMECAYKKRLELKKAYKDIGININPLVLIQLPNSDEGNIKREFVENFLQEKGISATAGNLAIWLSEEKQNTEGPYIIPNDSNVDFLIFKQAIDTGWDCPRAQILVKFRETQSIIFEIQTVGRILRMPEARHYENEILNKGYVYSNSESIRVKKEDFNPKILKNLHSRRNNKNYSLLKLKSYYRQRLDYGDITNALKFYPILENVFCEYFSLNSNQKAAFYKEQNLTLISKKINLDHLVDGDRIILNKVIESRLIDELKEIKATETLDTSLSEDDKLFLVNKLIKENLSGFAYKRSLSPVKESLYKFFREYLCTRDLENEIVYIQSAILNNINVFSKLLSMATEKYKPVKTEELKTKAQNLINWDLEWEIPESKSYNPEIFEKVDVLKSISTPCYLEINRSKPERAFIKYLEESPDVLWWWKNGDEHMRDNFGIQKLDTSSFQPDFIVMYSNGILGIYDTKDPGFQEDDNKIKAETLQKYIEEENKKNKNLIGGIIIKDSNNQLKINNNAIYKSYKTNPEEWNYLE
ncbi:MAG: hypothetical protein E7Z89_08560 [Cyanobacteria bacterium SIG28]|nr:hypothetical protein [Cyanobacteria bacterium SIG28]